jgi:hypothetical protein
LRLEKGDLRLEKGDLRLEKRDLRNASPTKPAEAGDLRNEILEIRY